MLMRFLGLAALVGIIGVAGVAGAITLRGGDRVNVTETSAGNVSLKQSGKAGPKSLRALTPTPARVVAEGPSPSATESTPAVRAQPPHSPRSGSLLSQGRTTLADSIFAMRSGDSVIVNFDTKGNRTRRADKFEQMVRTTLPMVYGRQIAPMLDSVRQGSLFPSRDIVGDLTTEGLHLRLDNGTKIALWPQTRQSTNGPLVVAYLVIVER